MSDTDQRPRILITRLSAIGDCILTLPVACALREHFPRSLIVWAVEPLAATLIAQHQAIDEIVRVPKGWLKSPRTMRALRDRLRTMEFDWALDPQSLTKSSMLAWLSGARNRIGFTRPAGREVAPWLNNVLIDRGPTHIVDASLKLLRPLGIERPDVQFEIPIRSTAIANADRFIRDTHLTRGFAVINGGASWPSKQWPADRLGRVARYLGEEHNLPTVVSWAGNREESLAHRVVAKSGGHAFQAPKTDLMELAALVRQARLVIGSDTGPLHLAVAVGTPCVGLYGLTRVENSGPYGTQHATVQVDTPRIRNRRRRQLDDSPMRRITVEAVFQACNDVLERPSTRISAHAA